MNIEFKLTPQEAVVVGVLAEYFGVEPRDIAKLILRDWLINHRYLQEFEPDIDGEI